MVHHWELPANQKVIGGIAPIFVQYIKELFFNDIGFGPAVTVCDVDSSYKPQSFDEIEEPCGDSFHVLFPYGGHTIKWGVDFDYYNPEEAPDFVFSDDFMQKLDRLKLEQSDFLTSWANWDHNDPKALLYVLKDLLAQYKEYQVSLLEDDSGVKEEYEHLVTLGGLAASVVEVLVGPGDTTRKTRAENKKSITFLARIPIDFSGHLPPKKDQPAEGDDDHGRVLLFAKFNDPNDRRPYIDLRYSSVAVDILRTSRVSDPSAFNGLAVHVAATRAVSLVRNALGRIEGERAVAREQRFSLLAALAKKLHPGLIEMDTKQFLKASFLCERDGFHLVLSVRLTEESTPQKPIVHLSSVYHLAPDGLPISKAMEDFPFANGWRPEEKAERILRFCTESVPEFRAECTRPLEAAIEQEDSSSIST